MAETLGTLVDKLTIVDLKLWHCQELLAEAPLPGQEGRREQLETKNRSLLGQRSGLIREIDAWIEAARATDDPSRLMAPSNKIYERSTRG